MIHIRVIIVVRGLTEAEGAERLADLLDELNQRDGLTQVSASWDAARDGLAVTIDSQSQDTRLCDETILDEVRDCVGACLESATDISYEIVESSFTSIA